MLFTAIYCIILDQVFFLLYNKGQDASCVLEIDLLGLCFYKVMLLCIFIFAQMKNFHLQCRILVLLPQFLVVIAYRVQNKS